MSQRMNKDIEKVQHLLFLWMCHYDKINYDTIKRYCEYLNIQFNLQITEHPAWTLFLPLFYAGNVDYCGSKSFKVTEPMMISHKRVWTQSSQHSSYHRKMISQISPLIMPLTRLVLPTQHLNAITSYVRIGKLWKSLIGQSIRIRSMSPINIAESWERNRVLMVASMLEGQCPYKESGNYIFPGISKSIVKELDRILCKSIRYE